MKHSAPTSLPRRGTTSEVGGIFSITTNMNTVMASNTVMANDTYRDRTTTRQSGAEAELQAGGVPTLRGETSCWTERNRSVSAGWI